MRVLLSIKPEHVARILSGHKTFEFRRKRFARTDVRTVLIYCTQPVARLVGEFDIADVLTDEPGALWRRTREGSGISKAYFDAYFAGRQVGYALRIGAVRAFSKPVLPGDMIDNFTPPQSYRYLPDGSANASPHRPALELALC